MIHSNVLSLIGETPLVRINHLVSVDGAVVLAKLEKMSVGGSIKDRIAWYLIEEAERKYSCVKDKVFIEASSGSTGIALAMVAAVKGYRMLIVMPDSVSIERRKLIQAYGAELVLSSGEQGTGGAIALKNQIIQQDPQKYIALNQHSNPVNILAHQDTTAEEIWRDTAGNFDMLVVAIGTGGTGIGVSKKIKQYNPAITVVGVTPQLGVSLQGLRNPLENNGSQIFDSQYFDEILEFEEGELNDIGVYSQRLAKEEGILVGMSSGAAMYVAAKKAQNMSSQQTIVTIFPDSGERYLSTDLF